MYAVYTLRDYSWNIYSLYVEASSCEVCQRSSAQLTITTTELHPVPVCTTWYHVAIDFIGPISPISLSGTGVLI